MVQNGKLKLSRACKVAMVGCLFGMSTLPAMAGELTIESWRNDDIDIWNEQIIPAFNKVHPDIKVTFAPTAPTDYNASLNARLSAGSAGDLITCRPFDASLDLFKKDQLTDLSSEEGLANFSDVAKSAWQTDDAKSTFCMPMASVIHGFIYNKDAFTELGLSVPKTETEFLATLEAIKKDGTYVPIAMGTSDQWEAATMGFQNIGPNYWDGEVGRKALLDGSGKLSDPAYVKTLEALGKWSPYMGKGYKAQKYSDSQNLFTLGRAAIYPAGSWDITTFNNQADFAMGAFPPPVPEGSDKCVISDHTDIALGINAASKNVDDAKVFVNWVASADFADIYSNALPGFFSLSNAKVSLTDPLAQEFVNWRDSCESSIRNSYQILSRGTPNLENEIWRVSVQVLNGKMTPEDGANELQAGLEKWYKP